MSETTTVTTAAAADPAVAGEGSRWLSEIEAYEREFTPWLERSERIAGLYAMQAKAEDDDCRFALLWSNVQVLKPTLYSRDPKPAVTRRFRDKDVAARTAAKLLERCLDTLLDRSGGDFGRAIREAVQERLLSARAVVRVRYQPSFREGMVEDEDAPVEFVHRRDFGHTAGARAWGEVTAVWFVSYMDRAALVRRFGPEAGERVALDYRRPGATAAGGAPDTSSKGRVYEVWDSESRRCVWVAKGMADALDARPYPLRLTGRFPCPAPLYGTVQDGTLIPVPDYVFYQDQAVELNTLTARIAKLTEALRLVGFADATGAGDLAKALSSPEEVAIVPVEGWAMQKVGTIIWLPIAEVATTLQQLIAAREAVKRDAYEVTGLSDILRGQTQASETATAQQIKAQWGGTRVREAQQDVARLCAEALTLMAQVVCGHFEPERIALLGYMEGMQEAMLPAGPPPSVPPGFAPLPAPTAGEEALRLLKGPSALLHARVDVESDSTIAPDEEAERDAVTSALQAVSGVLEKALPVLQPMAAVSPQAAAAFAGLMGAMMGGALRTIRKGEAIEAAAEQFAEAIAEAVKQPPPPKPEQGGDPAAEAKAQAEAQRTQLDGQRLQFDAAVAQDESRHRDEDRRVEVAKMRMEAMRPETAVVQH